MIYALKVRRTEFGKRVVLSFNNQDFEFDFEENRSIQTFNGWRHLGFHGWSMPHSSLELVASFGDMGRVNFVEGLAIICEAVETKKNWFPVSRPSND